MPDEIARSPKPEQERPWRFRRTLPPRQADGIAEFTLLNWDEFVLFIQREMATYGNYIWRGQKRHSWPLESSLDRFLREVGRPSDSKTWADHAGRFRMAMRGRRDPRLPPVDDEDDFWSLGQHHGLRTPLLDWTESPFVAAFFAFEEEDPDGTEFRLVAGLNRFAVESRSRDIERHEGRDSPHALHVVRPRTGDNSRLLAQSGVFTHGPAGIDVELWVRTYFVDVQKQWRLVRLLVPSSARPVALRALNRMNINHKSLFPDAEGAARYCNMCLSVRHYDLPEGRYEEPDPPRPVEEVTPPVAVAPASMGFELDSDSLMVIVKTHVGLRSIEDAVARRLGHQSGRAKRFTFYPTMAGWEYAHEASLFRAAGLNRTGDFERFLASLRQDDLVALLSRFNASGALLQEGFSLPQLAYAAMALQHEEAAFSDRFFAVTPEAKGMEGIEQKLHEFYDAVRLLQRADASPSLTPPQLPGS